MRMMPAGLDHVLKMWSCSPSWHDQSKAQKIYVCSMTLGSQRSQTRFRMYLFYIESGKRRSPAVCSWYTLIFLLFHHAFLLTLCYSWYQDIWKSFPRARKGSFCYYYCCCYYYYYYYCREERNWIWQVEGGPQQENVAGCREALGLRCERVIQDITNEDNAINMQSIENWTSGSKNATTAKLQLQHFLST